MRLFMSMWLCVCVCGCVRVRDSQQKYVQLFYIKLYTVYYMAVAIVNGRLFDHGMKLKLLRLS